MANASIVFRSRDMTGTGKIYVNTMQGAAELAARFRKAAHWVDVIDNQGKVAHRWERGNPNWEASDKLYFKSSFAPYDFNRNGDAFWEPENRARDLSDMLAFAFDVAIGREKPNSEYCPIRCVPHPDWSLQNLVSEAEALRRSPSREDCAEWASRIDDWMSDPDRLFLQYHVEYAALVMRFAFTVPYCRVWRLGVELAEAELDT